MRILLCSLFVLASFAVLAQNTGTISGKIIDRETSEPVIGATLLVENTKVGGITDLSGNFKINNVPAGEQLIRIKYIGYEDTVQTVSVVAGQTVTMQAIQLQSLSVGLNAVEVFANVVEDRKTPVAASTIDALVIEEQLGGMSLPEILNQTPGVYATQGDGSYGDAEMNIRGFSQVELLYMINGVPTNDMETGTMFWTNFAGMSDFTRSMQVQRGLGASKLAVNSVGGTVNILTQPAERRKGGSMGVEVADGTYTNRYKLALHTGLMKGNWAVSFQGSRTNGNGIRPGTFVDAWNYFIAISKKLNENHTLTLTAFGSPANRGRAYNSNTATYKLYDNYQYNSAVGYYHGKLYNTSQNKSHKPQINLMSNWTINDRMTLSTSAYLSIARVYGTTALRMSGYSQILDNDGLQNLDSVYKQNVANVQTIQNPYGQPYGTSVTGSQSATIIEARYNNHFWYGAISNLSFQINPTTSLVAGVDLREYKGSHYAQVKDLLGGSFWVDKDVSTNADNNVLTPNRIARVGDKTRYDYDGHVRWGAVFAQLEKTIDNLDVFLSVNGSQIQMWRVGNMWSGGSFEGTSLGESDKRVFQNYNAKAGVNYRIDGRHNVFVNGGIFTRAPFMGNAFQDSRYGNNFLQGLTNEKIKAIEAGYSYRTGRFRANLNAYYTQWDDKALVQSYRDPETNIDVYYAITGQGAVHKGIEIDGVYEVLPSLQLTAAGSFGDWEWSKNVNAFVTNSSGTPIGNVAVYTKGLKVGNTAQTTAYFGARYKGLDNLYFGFRFNYYGNLYEDYDPSTRSAEGKAQVRKLPDYSVVDIYAGYNFTMGGLRSRASGTVHNLLNQTYIRRSDEAFGVQELYGLPINFSASLSVQF